MAANPKPTEKFAKNQVVNNGFSTVNIVLCCLAFLLFMMSCIIFTNIWIAKKNLQIFRQHAEEIQRMRVM